MLLAISSAPPKRAITKKGQIKQRQCCQITAQNMTDLGHGFCGDTDFAPTHHLDDAVTDVIALDQHEDEQEKNHASKCKCDMKWPEQALQLRDLGVLEHHPDWSGVVGIGGTSDLSMLEIACLALSRAESFWGLNATNFFWMLAW